MNSNRQSGFLPFCAVGFFVLFLAQSLRAQSSGEDIRDIVIDPPGPNLAPFIIGTVVFLLAGAMAIIAFKKYLENPAAIEKPPPKLIARQKLKQISAQIGELPPNKASLAASETVKDFLTAEFSDPIRYETAEEYLQRISEGANNSSKIKLGPALVEEVRSFMAISQELKFAQIKEARDRVPALLKQAESIIEMGSRK